MKYNIPKILFIVVSNELNKIKPTKPQNEV